VKLDLSDPEQFGDRFCVAVTDGSRLDDLVAHFYGDSPEQATAVAALFAAVVEVEGLPTS
jgi:hypothetical protein